MTAMPTEERQLRADAARNRSRLIEAATTLFRERGLEVSVAEIAEAAEVGRGTLFRNFASKEDLIAAIVAERMRETCERARELLAEREADDALFEFLGEMVGRRQLDRAVTDAIDDTWLAREEIRDAHAELVGALDQLVRRAQKEGTVRPDIGAMDVLMLFKGLCAAATAFAHIDDPTLIDRHMDLLRASITTSGDALPLRGRAPTLEEIEAAEVS
jgi:AcrR family transcriptional regulator